MNFFPLGKIAFAVAMAASFLCGGKAYAQSGPGLAQRTVAPAARPVESPLEHDLPETLGRKAMGFYLSPRDKSGRVTSRDPLAGIETKDILAFIESHPELKDHRVVLVLPSLLRGKGKIEEIKGALSDLGLPTDIEVIRWPNGSAIENFLDFFPRKQDMQKPIREEIKTGHAMVFGGEALSMSLMLYLVLTKQLSPMLGAASTLLDLSQQAIITYPIRSLSNYLNRQSFARQFLFNIIFGAFTTTNFFLLMNSADLKSAMRSYWATLIPGSILSAIWGNTAVAAYSWEGSPHNRLPLRNKRIFRSNVLLAQQIILSPFYIYSVSPFAEKIFALSAFGKQVLDVNAGHLVILGAGAAAAASYPLMHRIAEFTSRLAEQKNAIGGCVRLLSGAKNQGTGYVE